MKAFIFSLLFTGLLISGFAQDLNFSVHGKYEHPISRTKLENARTMADIIPYYPENWIDNYNSAEISVNRNGNTETASSTNDILSDKQLMLLGSLEFGDEVVINIEYQRSNSITRETESGNIHYSTTLVPDTEAQYSGGYDQLSQYFRRNAIDKIPDIESKDLEQAVVSFVVNEKGEITDAAISKSSGKADIDRLLLDAINEMPDWQPASDSRGILVKQDFEFTLWGSGEGC